MAVGEEQKTGEDTTQTSIGNTHVMQIKCIDDDDYIHEHFLYGRPKLILRHH